MKTQSLSLFEVSGSRWINTTFTQVPEKFIKSKTLSLNDIFAEETLINKALNDDGAI